MTHVRIALSKCILTENEEKCLKETFLFYERKVRHAMTHLRIAHSKCILTKNEEKYLKETFLFYERKMRYAHDTPKNCAL